MSLVFHRIVLEDGGAPVNRRVRSTLEVATLSDRREGEIIQLAAIRKIAKSRRSSGEFIGSYRVEGGMIVCDINVIGMERWWKEAKGAIVEWDNINAEVQALYDDLEILDNAEALVDKRLRDAEMATKGET